MEPRSGQKEWIVIAVSIGNKLVELLRSWSLRAMLEKSICFRYSAKDSKFSSQNFVYIEKIKNIEILQAVYQFSEFQK